MLRRRFASMSVLLIASQLWGTFMPSAFAQNSASSALPSTGDNPDSWPWMQVNPDSVKKVQPASKAAASSTPDIPMAEPGLKPTSLDANASLVKPETVEKKETPKAAIAEPKQERPPEKKEFDVYKEPPKSGYLKEERATAAPTGAAQPQGGRMLFGRIEELASRPGASFPVQLRAQKATLDPRETQLKGAAHETIYSGSLVQSFPTSMEGTWGGTLRLMQIQIDPLAYQLDANDAKQTAELAKPGIDGQVNFTFQGAAGRVTLEPATIIFSSPMTESRLKNALKGGSTMIPGMGNMAAMPGMAQMMQQMMGSMPYMWGLHLGTTQGVGVSGNSVSTSLISNTVRQLSPTVLEEQVVSKGSSTNPENGRTQHTYSESVLRFTQYNSSQKYVQAACVDYSADKHFLRKMVFAGYVTKGAVQNPMPMGGLGAGLNGTNGANGLNGMGGLEKLFAPGLNLSDPNANPFKQLFGQ